VLPSGWRFGATPHRVEWCFSRSGLLLYVLDGVEGGRVTTVEATEVSEVVSDGDFVVASSRREGT
jgi:hypothetical protein